MARTLVCGDNGKWEERPYLPGFELLWRLRCAGSGRHLSWKLTGKAIQSAGYYFRDALFLVDDYKREDVRYSDCVMVLQCYADRTGRSRLKSDATMNTTRPIRGLLISTGEDFPEANASGRGRAVVIPVPNPEKDYDRFQRCLSHCHLYRGWTAAFLAHVIRNKLGQQFKRESSIGIASITSGSKTGLTAAVSP